MYPLLIKLLPATLRASTRGKAAASSAAQAPCDDFGSSGVSGDKDKLAGDSEDSEDSEDELAIGPSGPDDLLKRAQRPRVLRLVPKPTVARTATARPQPPAVAPTNAATGKKQRENQRRAEIRLAAKQAERELQEQRLREHRAQLAELRSIEQARHRAKSTNRSAAASSARQPAGSRATDDAGLWIIR